MERALSADPGWEVVVAGLSIAQDWGLDLVAVERYCEVLRSLLPPDATAEQIRRICSYYHQDHRLVAALRDQGNSMHSPAWSDWTRMALQVLHKAGLGTIGDHAVAAEDLAQAALVEIARALPNFRYQSRLTTWAHAVIVQTARRLLRDSRAQKRPRNLPSLDQTPALAPELPEADLPEAQASTAVLIALVQQVLLRAGDQRLATVFYLAAVEDLSTDDIAKLVQLHPSRVRALLAQCRSILQRDPALLTWLAEIDTPSQV